MFGVGRGRSIGRAAALLVLVLASGCGEDTDAASTTTAASTTSTTLPIDFEDHTGVDRVDMTVVDNTFLPRYVEVSAGTTLTFTNNGRNPHDITPVVEGTFEKVPSSAFTPGSTAELTFSTAGEVRYYCSIHGTPRNGQNGIIKVVP